MELLNSLRRGNLLFQNRTIYSFYHHESHGKVKDKEHLNLRCLVQVSPGHPHCHFGITTNGKTIVAS